MYIIDQIEELVSEMNIRGEEIGPFVYLGSDVYNEMRKHMALNTSNPYAMLDGTGYATLQIMTSAATLKILRDPDRPADSISINGRTLLDIVVERELLGL